MAFSTVSVEEREVRRLTQLRAELRKGRRMSTLGRVKPWSRVLREGMEEAWVEEMRRARCSLFLRTLVRVLRRELESERGGEEEKGARDGL